MWRVRHEDYTLESAVTRKDALLAAQSIRAQYAIVRGKVPCGPYGELMPGANEPIGGNGALQGEPLTTWQSRFFIPRHATADIVKHALEQAGQRNPACADQAWALLRQLRASKVEPPGKKGWRTVHEGLEILTEVIGFLRVYLRDEAPVVPPSTTGAGGAKAKRAPARYPAEHYTTTYGIPAARLYKAHRRGRLKRARKVGERLHYPLSEVCRLWPQDVVEE
jgi:hypothetical protein